MRDTCERCEAGLGPRRRGSDLQLRVHVLPVVLRRDVGDVPELRRGAASPALAGRREPRTWASGGRGRRRSCVDGRAVATYDLGDPGGAVVHVLPRLPVGVGRHRRRARPGSARAPAARRSTCPASARRPSRRATATRSTRPPTRSRRCGRTAASTRTLLVAHDYSVSVGQELLARRAEGGLAVELTGVVWMNGGLYPDLHRPTVGQQLLLDPEQGAEFAAGMTEELFVGGHRRHLGRADPVRHRRGRRRSGSRWTTAGGGQLMHELLHYIADRREHAARWAAALEGQRPADGVRVGRPRPGVGRAHDRARRGAHPVAPTSAASPTSATGRCWRRPTRWPGRCATSVSLAEELRPEEVEDLVEGGAGGRAGLVDEVLGHHRVRVLHLRRRGWRRRPRARRRRTPSPSSSRRYWNRSAGTKRSPLKRRPRTWRPSSSQRCLHLVEVGPRAVDAVAALLRRSASTAATAPARAAGRRRPWPARSRR